MPARPKRACKRPGCPRLTTGTYCEAHKPKAKDTYDRNRPSATDRGYGPEWRQIREQVLEAYEIPRSEWGRYDVDHEPRYDRARQPDHRKYRLTPRLHGEHSRKTVQEDGGFGR